MPYHPLELPLVLVGVFSAMANRSNSVDDTEACTLVGMFLQRWALLEAEIHRCISTAMNLSDIVGAAICANMALRDKLFILSTGIHLTYMNDDKKAEYDRCIEKIRKSAQKWRNICAHAPFAGDQKGVRFLQIIARGPIEIPDIIWTRNDFKERMGKVDTLAGAIHELNAEISKMQSITDLARALLGRTSKGAPIPETTKDFS